MKHGTSRALRSQFAVFPGGGRGILQGGPGDPGPGREKTPVWRSRLPLAISLGAALLAAAFWFLTTQSGPTALRHLPPEERAALAQRTLSNLREICQRAERPREFCREQATLLLDLPECVGACRTAARDELMVDSAVK